jgi:hypothetical protein
MKKTHRPNLKPSHEEYRDLDYIYAALAEIAVQFEASEYLEREKSPTKRRGPRPSFAIAYPENESQFAAVVLYLKDFTEREKVRMPILRFKKQRAEDFFEGMTVVEARTEVEQVLDSRPDLFVRSKHSGEVHYSLRSRPRKQKRRPYQDYFIGLLRAYQSEVLKEQLVS